MTSSSSLLVVRLRLAADDEHRRQLAAQCPRKRDDPDGIHAVGVELTARPWSRSTSITYKVPGGWPRGAASSSTTAS